MKKKAQLDILDLPLNEDETSSKGEKGSKSTPEKGAMSRKRRFFLCIAVCVIILIAIQCTLWYFLSINPAKKKERENIIATVSDPTTGRLDLNEFFVHVRDDQGNPRVLVCSFILDVDPLRQPEISQRQNDIRKFIYETIARHPVSELLDPRGKRSLKKELFVGLERIMGKDALRALYVDKYIIL